MRASAVWGQAVLALLFAGAWAFASPQTTVLDASSHQIFLQKLVTAAIERTHHNVRYNPSYVRIPYPGGEVPEDMRDIPSQVPSDEISGRIVIHFVSNWQRLALAQEEHHQIWDSSVINI
jgi:uncharacterized protein YijF (DUF1287 family)